MEKHKKKFTYMLKGRRKGRETETEAAGMRVLALSVRV